jgi:PAS domain S-box-containing protein
MKHRIVITGDEIRSLIILSKTLTIVDPRLEAKYCEFQKQPGFCAEDSESDLILLDFNLAEETAAGAVMKIRKMKGFERIPVLMLTSFTSSETIQKAINAGVDDFVRKPVDRVELILRIRSLIYRNKLQLENLRQSEELMKFSLAADKSDNSIVIINPEGKIEWVNKGFVKLYEYSLDEFKDIFGKTVGNFGIDQKLRQSLENSAETKKPVIYENVWFTKTGKKKWIQTTITPIIDDNGHVDRFVAVETDITSLKAVEEELIHKNASLTELTKSMEAKTQMLEDQQVEIEKQKKLVEEQRKKADDLLLNIFPFEIAEQLKINGYARSKQYRMATVMFTDFVGFSKLAEKLSTQKLIHELSTYFEKFDYIARWHFVEKIKTVGDSYMCAGGLPLKNRSNPFDTVLAALEMLSFVREANMKKLLAGDPIWDIRIGIHTGEVIAGVIGHTKIAYDIWGDTVNMASRMETSGEAGKVNISGATYDHIKDYFDCTYRGKITAKNKGEIDMYFVNGLKPDYAEDSEGLIPNGKFLSMHSGL